MTVRSEVKHVQYNPCSTDSFGWPLGLRLADHEKDGWELVRVTPVSNYLSVAVFHRAVHDDAV